MNGTLPDRRTALRVGGTALLVAVVVPFVVFALPQAIGAEASYVVLSDSMNPTIDAGDAVIVNDVPADRIEEGDVITFDRAGGSNAAPDDLPVTHRVTEVVHSDGERLFRTKGDANEDVDRSLVPPENVHGRVMVTVPYLGYGVRYANTEAGLVALVILPSLALVGSELATVVGAVRGGADATETPAPDEGETERTEDG